MTRTVALLAGRVGRAHANRLSLIGDELTAAGHTVVAPTHLPDIEVADFTANVYAEYTPEIIDASITAERELIERCGAEVVVADLRPTAAISARLAGVPLVTVVNAFMTDAFDPTTVLASNPSKAARLAGRGIQSAQKRSLATPFRDAARAHGRRDLRSLYDFFSGDVTLVADLPEFVPVDGLQYIGPLVWEPPDAPPAADPSRPLVYATLGNTGGAALVELVLAAFADAVYEVVLTVGPYVELPRAAPPHVHVIRSVAGSQVLRRATAVIHCGGSGTTYQALAEGVPAVVVPFNAEQELNARLVARHRLGVALDLAKTAPSRLRAAVELVREVPELRAPLLRFQQLVRASDGPSTAAQVIAALR
jgi:UDP:flavonoid glycosyltransferase YjiC (YdhE family)